jgi:hypothetical protein
MTRFGAIGTGTDLAVWTVARKASDSPGRTTTTLADDDDLVLAVAANTDYMVLGLTTHSSTAAASGIREAFTVPAGATMDIVRLMHRKDGSALRQSDHFESSGTADSGAYDVTNPNYSWIQGTISIAGTAGNFAYQWAQHSADAGNPTIVRAGSHLAIMEIP